MSKILNRKLLVFPIIQHYVLNRKFRNNSNNLKYWNFNEIFFYDDNEMGKMGGKGKKISFIN